MADFRLQPIVDLYSGATVGLELLAGQLSCPDWDAQQWRAWYARLPDILGRYAPEFMLTFVNATGLQILDPEIRDSLLRCASRRCVVLEWTENPQPCDLASVIDTIQVMSPAFAALAVDDVGDGIDGIGRTLALSPNFAKLSMKLLWHARFRPAFLQHIGDLFSGMGAAVIAEGVETQNDLALARASGVRYGQGFLFGAGHVDDSAGHAGGPNKNGEAPPEMIVRFAPAINRSSLTCGSPLCRGRRAMCKPFPPRQKKAS